MDSKTQIAEKFTLAFYEKKWPGELCSELKCLSIQEAYEVQDLIVAQHEKKSESVVGYKVGCTSDPIRQQFGLTEPISGRMFSPYIYPSGTTLSHSRYVNCAIEPELVIKFKHEISGQDLDYETIINAIDWVSCGIEIHNFKFWHMPPSSQELICSGGIWAGLVIGEDKVSPEGLRFDRELFQVYRNDQLVCGAQARDIMDGGPLKSLRWLINFLNVQGKVLPAGSIVIPGSPTPLVEVAAGEHITVKIDGVGQVRASFTD